jgi:hypothetical protein
LGTLASVGDDGLGEELQVIWEVEPGARVIEKVALPEPTGIGPTDRLDAFLDAVRWHAVSTADVKSIQAPFRIDNEFEEPPPGLRAEHAVAEQAAQGKEFVIPQNMRVPASSVGLLAVRRTARGTPTGKTWPCGRTRRRSGWRQWRPAGWRWLPHELMFA